MTRALRAATRGLALAALPLLLSGCIKLTMDLDVASDDTVSGTVILAVDKNLLELSGSDFEDAIGSDALVPPDVEGVSVEPYDDDEFVGQEITFDGTSLDEVNQGGGGEDDFNIVREGDTFRVSGVLDLTFDQAETEGVPIDPEQLFESADISITLSFPGEVRSANGEIDGNTVTWTPQVGERTALNAVASAVGGGSSMLWIVLAVVALVVIAAIALLATRRKAPAITTPTGEAVAGTPVHEHADAPVASPPVPTGPVTSAAEPTEPVASPAVPTEPVPTQPEPTEVVPSQPEPTDVVPPPPPPTEPGQPRDERP
jgi:hypothetical protein